MDNQQKVDTVTVTRYKGHGDVYLLSYEVTEYQFTNVCVAIASVIKASYISGAA